MYIIFRSGHCCTLDYLVPSHSIPGVRFRPGDEQKYLSESNLVMTEGFNRQQIPTTTRRYRFISVT